MDSFPLGQYVTDDGNSNLYYAVQIRNSTINQPENLILYSDIRCDPATAKKSSDIVGTLVPASGGGGGAASIDTEINVLTDSNDNVVFLKYTDGVVTYFSEPTLTTPVVPTLPFKSNSSAVTKQYTPGYIRVTTAGTVAAGAQRVSIANVGAASGTVLGTTLGVNEVVDFEVTGINTLGAIAYVATGTTFAIAEVR